MSIFSNKPIKPGAHGALDYGLFAANLTAPSLLGLKGAAKTLSYLFGGIQGSLNAITDQPLALSRVVPFRTHGTAELMSLPALLALPFLTEASKDPRARNYFLAQGALLLLVYSLTDWDAKPEQ